MLMLKQLAPLQHLLSEQYLPAGPQDFIGPTQAVAHQLQKYVDLANATGREPLRIMLCGDPGLAKSALARWFGQKLLGVHPKWSTYKFSGVDVSVDKLRELAGKLQLRDMFSDWRLIWIEEADRIPDAAQVRFLMLLDELIPGTAIICTSNKRAKEFETRFQTRFVFPSSYILPPSAAEIEQFITRKVGVPHPALRTACELAAGNVRAAINDAIDLYLNHPIPVAKAA